MLIMSTAGKYDSKNPPASNRMFGNQPWEKVTPLLDTMKEIAKTRDVPVSAVALNWVMAKGALPLGGARNAQQAAQVRSQTRYPLRKITIGEFDWLISNICAERQSSRLEVE